MAWKGVEDDSRLFWSRLDGDSWSSQEEIWHARSSHGPALASHGAGGADIGLLMAWKEEEDDFDLYFARNPTLLAEG